MNILERLRRRFIAQLKSSGRTMSCTWLIKLRGDLQQSHIHGFRPSL